MISRASSKMLFIQHLTSTVGQCLSPYMYISFCVVVRNDGGLTELKLKQRD